jgi:starvation-inducible DNA-binding protein
MSQSDDNQFLYSVRIDIPPEIRLYVVQLLNQTLACTVDLRSQIKQACWNVKGHDLVLLHALFATMATELDAYTDLVAERLVVLGGVARGTARTAATHSRLPEYPGAIMDGDAHVRALTECFASYATALRADIAHATEVEDAGSAAIYTDISRGVDKRLGFLEAYLHHDGVSTEPARHDGSQAARHDGSQAARHDGRRAE